MIEIGYTEKDGLLYPDIEIGGANRLAQLGKYGLMRLDYLHGHKTEIYRKLLITGKLAEHCENVDKMAFECSERIRAAYLETNPMPEDDTMERIRLSVMAQDIADQIVMAEMIYA